MLSSCAGLGKSRPDLRRAMSLRSVDVMATRIWFDKKVREDAAAVIRGVKSHKTDPAFIYISCVANPEKMEAQVARSSLLPDAA